MKLKLKLYRRSVPYQIFCGIGQCLYRIRKRLEKWNHQLDELAGKYDPTEPY